MSTPAIDNPYRPPAFRPSDADANDELVGVIAIARYQRWVTVGIIGATVYWLLMAIDEFMIPGGMRTSVTFLVFAAIALIAGLCGLFGGTGGCLLLTMRSTSTVGKGLVLGITLAALSLFPFLGVLSLVGVNVWAAKVIKSRGFTSRFYGIAPEPLRTTGGTPK